MLTAVREQAPVVGGIPFIRALARQDLRAVAQGFPSDHTTVKSARLEQLLQKVRRKNLSFVLQTRHEGAVTGIPDDVTHEVSGSHALLVARVTGVSLLTIWRWTRVCFGEISLPGVPEQVLVGSLEKIERFAVKHSGKTLQFFTIFISTL